MGFRLAQMAGLARQLMFSPSDQRGRQVAAAEALLLQVDPAKAYPFDFIVFRITGYHARPLSKGAESKSAPGADGDLLTGLAIQHDLGLLVELVSGSLKVRVMDLDEPVLTIEQVAQQFNASEKSIQRWRRRGLAARLFIFPDGRKRVGFLAGSVERFLAVHHDCVARAANFSPIDSPERRRIVAAASRLARTGSHVEEIYRRIGRRLDRSPLTIAHVVEEHDRCQPAEAIIPRAALAPTEAERAEIVGRFATDARLAALARRVGRSRAAVYRVLLESRLDQLNAAKVKFIDDSLYHQPEAAAVVDQLAAQTGLDSDGGVEDRRVPRDLPPYIAALYRTPLLTAAQERGLFLKLHFHKFQFVTLRRRVEAEKARWRDVTQLEAYLGAITATRSRIVAGNLRLVVSVARKHVPAGRCAIELMDLVSDGNVTLMKAADTFDFHRGNRFSTYASLALMKEFARSVPAARRRRGAALGENVSDVRLAPVADRIAEREQVDHLLARLPQRERSIVQARYGLTDDQGAPAASLEELARHWNLTPKRLLQLERAAIAQLRQDSRPA